MSVTNDMSLFSLLSGASVPVQLVMALLVITSLVSWWYIFIKAFTIKRRFRGGLLARRRP
jgi:biopolymer transport protein TolQ